MAIAIHYRKRSLKKEIAKERSVKSECRYGAWLQALVTTTAEAMDWGILKALMRATWVAGNFTTY
jgi:hypothetical protein